MAIMTNKQLISMLKSEPKLIRLSSQSIVHFKLELPSGVLMMLSSGNTYTTNNKADIEFLSKQKGIMVTDISDAEYRRHYTKLFQELPNVYNKEMPPEEIEAFKWTTEEEKLIVEELKKRGYKIAETSIETEKAYSPIGDDKVKIVKPRTKPAPKKSSAKTAKPTKRTEKSKTQAKK